MDDGDKQHVAELIGEGSADTLKRFYKAEELL